MNIHLSHTRQVFGEATEVLVGSGTSRERLRLAAKIILGIAPGDFDRHPELKAQYDAIYKVLTKERDERRGAFAATVDKMSSPAMKKLAESILSLDRAIREAE